MDIIVFICTGRSYRMAQEYFDQLAFSGIVFTVMVLELRMMEILETRDLDPATVERLRTICDNLGEVDMVLLTTTYAYQNAPERNRMSRFFSVRHAGEDLEDFRKRRSMACISEYEK